ncbi:MAG TPA: MlaD family protein [Ignavibacteria bacterium]|nr:MlaD family protein [Ignavibacteria bacterium]
MDTSKKIKLGFFITIGLGLFVIALFYIGSKENLFTATIILNSEFEDVSGLTTGSNVTYSGINIGSVQSIDIQGFNKVRVVMKIQKDKNQFIRKDSQVSITSTGLVGSKIVSISSGSDTSKIVENGDYLKSIKPIDVGTILDNLNNSTKQADSIAKEITSIVSKVNSGAGSLGELINNKSLYQNLDSAFTSIAGYTEQVNLVANKMTGIIDQVSNEVNVVTKEISKITANIAGITAKLNSGESVVGTLLTDTVFANNLKDIIVNTNLTVRNFESAAFKLDQNMEALKHNFLFKGYFEDLGYWDSTTYQKQLNFRVEEIDKQAIYIKQQQEILKKLQTRLEELERQVDEKMKKDGD